MGIVALGFLLGLLSFGIWVYVGDAPYRATAVPQPRNIDAVGDTLTFLAWSDQHVTREGSMTHLAPAIDAMNGIEGLDYPPEIGGKVGRPAFVIGAGDCTDWPSHAAMNAFADATRRLRYVSFNIVGNHDEGDVGADSRVARWIAARHGGLSYTFDAGNVRFLCVYSKDNPKQLVTREAMDFVRRELAAAGDRPVVVVMHYCLDAIGNKQEFAACLKGGNVVLVLGGHYHHAIASTYEGRQFLQLPSPEASTQFAVIRITPGRVMALMYDYGRKRWAEGSRARISAALRGPEDGG